MSIIHRTTILLDRETRILLSKIGRKEQTYDEIIKELIESKNKLELLEEKTGHLSSSKPKHSQEESLL